MKPKMNNRKKMTVVAAASLLAVAGLTLAIYTAREDSDFVAIVGTVDIDVHDPELDNQWNINPGDGDPDNPAGSTGGTSHELRYTVTNLGSKSVRTRHSIILTVKDRDDENVLLDARYVSLRKDGKELGEPYKTAEEWKKSKEGKIGGSKTYILEGGEQVPDAEFDMKDERKVVAVRYCFVSDNMDGYGIDLAKGGKAEKETSGTVRENAQKLVQKQYTSDFCLDREAGNEYQKAVFGIDVYAEAMQYRNTDETFWLSFYSDNDSAKARGFTTVSGAAVVMDTVPARDEADGLEKDGHGEEKMVDNAYPKLEDGAVRYDFPIFDDEQFNLFKTNEDREAYYQKLSEEAKKDFDRRMKEYREYDLKMKEERAAYHKQDAERAEEAQKLKPEAVQTPDEPETNEPGADEPETPDNPEQKPEEGDKEPEDPADTQNPDGGSDTEKEPDDPSQSEQKPEDEGTDAGETE